MTTLLFGRREQSRHCPSQVTANQLFTLFDLNLKKRYSFLTSVFLVFILLLIGSDHIKAQATPPCECDAPIDIGCSGSVVYYDELLFEFEENQCYQILCTLVIDAGLVNWNEVSLLMGEGSMIEVLSSLAVRDSYIGACDEMWQGFKARDGSQFIISGSRIESAEFGIQFESCTEFNCTHNDFVNNYIGIASGSPFEPIEFHVIRQGNLYGCRFWTEGTVPGPYPDQHYYPSWPEEPSEVPYDQGFAAIYFAGLSGLNVGLLGAPYSARNRIFQMRNGVVLIESSSDVLNTDFKNFEGGVPPDFYDELDPLLDINQEAIHLVSSNCNILRDSIINVHRGIVSLNSSSTISDNFLNISIPFITSFTRGMDIDQPARLIIDRNLVQNGFKGISVRDVHIPIRITHNTLNRILSSPRNAAIDIQFLRHLDLPRGLVEDNTINIDHAIASVGINLNNVTAIIVSANPITYTSSFGAGFGNGGIVVTESAGNYLDRNVITGNGSYFSLAANSGITINTSVQNELFCNELTEMHYGMQIAGFNDISPLKTNYFDDANVGLLLRSPCMIGKQDQYGNRWIGEFGNNNTYGAFIHGPDPEGTADLSLFIADESDEDACILIPCAIGPPAIDMGNWFVDENGTGLICETQGGNPQPVADSMIVRLQNPFAFSEYNDEMNWQVKASYFELLLQYPDLLAEDFLDSFYTAEAAQSLGKLMTYRHLLLKDHSLDPEGKSDILEIVDRVSTDIILIDSILYLRPADSLDWMELRELKTDTLTDAHLEWLEVESDDITLSFAVFEEVLDSLDNLIPSDETASNVRQALIFSAFHKTGIPFDPTDSSDLYLLATQCPWLGHMSLGFGQRYYAEITDSTMSSIIYECQEPEPYQEWSPAIQFDQNIHLEVYPNPSTNELSIETESDVEWIFITNVNGQVLGEWQSPGPRLSLYIGSWSPGIYFLYAKNKSGATTRRIQILK